jgi:hypothetical protein
MPGTTASTIKIPNFQIVVTTPMELLKIQLQDAGRTAVKGIYLTILLVLFVRLVVSMSRPIEIEIENVLSVENSF